MAYEVFGDDDVPQEDIIDEEELIMLRELKDLKKDYRENFAKLKEYKSDIQVIAQNVNTSKEQMIIKFELWYQEEFDIPVDKVGVSHPIDTDLGDGTDVRMNLLSQGHESSKSTHQVVNLEQEDQIEDEDAATYRRAK